MNTVIYSKYVCVCVCVCVCRVVQTLYTFLTAVCTCMLIIMGYIIFIIQRYYRSTNHSVCVYSKTVCVCVCVCVCVQRFKLCVFTAVRMYAHAVLPMRYCPCNIAHAVLHHVFYTMSFLHHAVMWR